MATAEDDPGRARPNRRETLLAAASLALLGPAKAAAAADGGPVAFRRAGGKVAAFFYGGWTQYGSPTNPAPWLWINRGFTDRLPLRSVALPGHWIGWTFDARDKAYPLAGTPGAVRLIDARLTPAGDHMLFAPTGPHPAIQSPDAPGGWPGRDYPAIRFRIRRSGGTAWKATIAFATRERPDVVERVAIAEPVWSGGIAEVAVDMAGNASWAAGNIRRFTLELGASPDEVYELHGRVELIPSPAQAAVLAGIQGLPMDAQWAADWQQDTAAAHGIDALMMCTYWDGQGSAVEPVAQAMFASRAAPRLKLGFYFDNLTARRPTSLAEFDRMLAYWNRFFASDKFWRIGGRPVVGWHGGDSTRDYLALVPEFKGLSATARVQAMVCHMQDFYRTSAGSHARDGLYFVTGNLVDHPYWTGSVEGHGALWQQAGFDAGTTYNQFFAFVAQRQHVMRDASGAMEANGVTGGRLPAQGTVQTYEQMRRIYRATAQWIVERSGNTLAYFVPASAGWDIRPWIPRAPGRDYACAPTWGCEPDAVQFRLHLKDVRGFILANLSKVRTTEGPVTIINAWDEFGEGGFLAPTRGLGKSRLEAVRDIFGLTGS